jgi:hypothetical protein
MEQKTYNFPVYGTQGGGLVREIAPNLYRFVEKPNCPGLDVGDTMPKEWGIVPVNQRAQKFFEEELTAFDLESDMFLEANERP